MSIIADHLFDPASREQLRRDIGEIVRICGMEVRVTIDESLPAGEMRFSCGSRPENCGRIVGLGHNGEASR